MLEILNRRPGYNLSDQDGDEFDKTYGADGEDDSSDEEESLEEDLDDEGGEEDTEEM